MFRLLVFAIISSTVYTQKCCPHNEYLTLNQGEYECTPTANVQHFELITNTLEYFENCTGTCIDFLLEETQHSLVEYNCNRSTVKNISHIQEHPKCCPYNYYYDPQQHGCIKSNQTNIPNEPLLLKLSLSHCPVQHAAIVDYLEETQIREDRSIILKNGRRYERGRFCLDKTEDGEGVVRTCENYNVACKTSFDSGGQRCIRKCCPDGYAYVNGPSCKRTFDYGIQLTHKWFKQSSENFAIIQSQPGRKYLAKADHVCSVDRIGSLHCSEKGKYTTYSSLEAIYCTETVATKGVGEQKLFLFFKQPSSLSKFKMEISGVGLLISCVFLALTIAGYFLLLESLNLFARSTICYCLVTLIGYATLAYTQLTSPTNNKGTVCTTLGFMITFSFLGSFTWLNIICFDMYTAFGTMTVRKIGNSRRRTKRFIFYNLYGWGVPIIITLTMFVIYYTKILPWYLTPQIGIVKCFFDRGSKSYDHLIYFVIPLAILILCNAILFLKTIRYYLKVKTEINSMKDTLATDKEKRRKIVNADREKLVMLIKLFLIMGISWLFEVFSSIFPINDNQFLLIVETIWDAFNSLQGLFIFCIFMLKGKMLASFKKKFCNRFDRRASNQSSTTLATNVYSSSVDPRCVRLMSRDKSTEKEF